MSRRAILVAGCLIGLFGRPAAAEPTEAESRAAARQVLIALRVLAYDKSLATRRPGDGVTIMIVSRSTASSRRERERWEAGFSLLPKIKVGGRLVRVLGLDFQSEQAFAATVAKYLPAAVIVVSDIAAELPAIRKVSRARDMLTLSQREQAVRDGLAVGLVAGAERAEIVINVEAAREEGVRFGAGLLQLARLVDEVP
ncbi:MAG: YfiR family protein [Kofleriaceae bacterium]